LSKFPSTAQLLSQGGDARLCLDPLSGANHYLCRPFPDPDLLKLGSSTASTISQRGFDIADRMRNRMAEACRHRDPELVYQACADHIAEQLRRCLHLDARTAIKLAESGTDAHRLAVRRVLSFDHPHPLRVLMVESSETGSGVPDALCSTINASPGDSIHCSEIAIRDADAIPLPVAVIDAAVLAQAEQAIERGEQLLLVMVDQSKSGCIAPSLSCGLDLRRRYPGRVHLLLDACQFRFSQHTLNHYLQHGIMVAITGSKFIAGPSFSGALLLPNHEPVAVHASNPGLLMRWQVALQTLRELSALNDRCICEFLEQCGDTIRQRLVRDPAFEPLPTPAIIRQQSDRPAAWDDLPTIFPFRLRLSPEQGSPTPYASYEDCMSIYRQLQQGDAPRVQLGRPIVAGRNCQSNPPGALRLCISAPMVIDAISHHQQSAVIAQCMLALDQVSESVCCN